MIVGLLGRMRSGKDSLASALVERYGFRRRALADPLKELLLDVDPVVLLPDGTHGVLRSLVESEGWEGAKAVPGVREMLQALGEGARQRLGDDVWVRPLLPSLSAGSVPTVVTDVRYRNEADALVRAGGLLVRVLRPGAHAADAASLHVSETELHEAPVHLEVVNDGTLDELRLLAPAVVEATAGVWARSFTVEPPQIRASSLRMLDA